MRGGIPSGGSPLYLGDFATPMTAMTQKMISTMLDRHDKKQEQLSKEQEWFLKNLDFTTVEDISDQQTQVLLQKQNELEDWATQQYLENDLMLPDETKLELKRKKRQYEQYAARLKSDVSAGAFAQKELVRPDAMQMYDVDSYKKLGEWRESGGVNLNAHEILIPKRNMDKLVDQWTDGWDSKELYQEDSRKDPSTGMEYTFRSNKGNLQKKYEALQQNPEWQEIKSHPVYGPEARNAMSRRMTSLANETTPSRSLSGSEMNAFNKANAVSNLSDKHKKVVDKYGIGLTDPVKIETVITANNLTQKALFGDRETLDNHIIGKTKEGWGTVVDYRIDKDGTITLFSNNKNSDPWVMPKVDKNDTESVKNGKRELMEFLPNAMQGKDSFTGLTSYIFGDWEVDGIEPAPITEVGMIESALDLSDVTPGDEWNYREQNSKGEWVDKKGKVLDMNYRQKIVDNLKSLFPKDKISTSGNWDLTGKERPLSWGKDTYDLLKEEDRQRLIAKMKKLLGIKEVGESEYSTGGYY